MTKTEDDDENVDYLQSLINLCLVPNEKAVVGGKMVWILVVTYGLVCSGSTEAGAGGCIQGGVCPLV